MSTSNIIANKSDLINTKILGIKKIRFLCEIYHNFYKKRAPLREALGIYLFRKGTYIKYIINKKLGIKRAW